MLVQTLPAHSVRGVKCIPTSIAKKSKKTRTLKKSRKVKESILRDKPVVPLRHSCPQLADKLQLSLPRHSPSCPTNTVLDTTVDVLIKVKIELKILTH